MESGYQAALEILEENREIRILSCATDTIAAGAIEALLTYSRKKVPEEARRSGGRMRYILDNSGIRVTGFGDNQFLKAVTGGDPDCTFRVQDQRDPGSGTASGRDRAGGEDSR